MDNILFALWFFWPAGVAIMVPVFAAHMPGLRRWNQPMDGGRHWRGKRLLGANKTWRGLLTGTLAGTIWTIAQMALYNHSEFVRSFSIIDYGQLSIIWLGLAISLGALLGDAVGSFLKRQLNIAPGTAWFPYDQIDFIVGGLLLSLAAVQLQVLQYVVIAGVWLGVHLLFGVLGYITHLQDHPL